MRYYLDGYNLLFRLSDVNEDDLQSSRDEILEFLSEKVEMLELDVTVIFDAPGGDVSSVPTQFRCLRICYSAPQESADDYIIEELSFDKHPRNITVVTSDNRLAWRARHHRAKTMTVEAFLAWLNKRCKKIPRKTAQKKIAKNPKMPREMERWLRIFEERCKNDEEV